MKNKSGKAILEAYKECHKFLTKRGFRPQLHILDNECSESLKQFMESKADEDFQTVPPHQHRRNAAERSMQTFKNHFVAGLCSTNPEFPLHLWDRLVPQAEISLNLLRGSRLNPKLSAYAQMHGLYNFNKTPIAPPGIRVVVHEKPSQ